MKKSTLLIDIKNGQHFCQRSRPCSIFKRLRDITRLATDWDTHSFADAIHVECWDYKKGEEVTFYNPKKTNVIPLGKK